MKIKDGANIQGINIALRPALIAADAIWKKNGQELVITSGLDGAHSAGSLHYYGLAIDCRTRDFSKNEISGIVAELSKILGHDFDIIAEPTHIHIEYDPK